MYSARQPLSYNKALPRGTDKRSKETLGTLLARNPTSVLLLLSLFMFAVTGAYWHTNDMTLSFTSPFRQAGTGDGVPRNISTDRNVNHRFVMGGVNLGMTRTMVESNHPDARTERDRNGEAVLTIPTPNGMLVAWFYEHDEWLPVDGRMVHDPIDRVYRLRLDEAFVNMSEQDVISRYAREYGRPIDTSCSRGDLGDSPRCTYYWWGGDGIELKATLKQKTDVNGQVYTLLTTIATNTVKPNANQKPGLSQVTGTHRWGYIN